MEGINYLPGVYRITPLGPQTAFECIVQRSDNGYDYALVDLDTNDSLEVTQSTLDMMRPVFIRLSGK